MDQAFAKVIGANVARLRKARGWSQEDLAHHARRMGLGWSRSTVARVETGRIDITYEDLLLLINVLGVKEPQLLQADGQVDIGKLRLAGDSLPHLPEGDRFVLPGAPELLSDSGIVAQAHPRWVRRAKKYGFHADEMEAVLWGVDETDRRAAEQLGVEPEEVALVAHHRWKKKLAARRDELVAAEQRARVDKGEGEATIRGLRGKVTKVLVEELRPHVSGGRR